MHRRIIGIAAITCIAGCASPGAEGEFDRVAVTREVDSTVRAFQEAERSLDPERILAFIAPEFFMYSDGVRQDYEATAVAIRAQMPTLRFFEPEWTDIAVTVLGPDGAVTSMLFRDSIIDGDGQLLQLRGPFTAAWRRFGNDWRMVFADADHYPVVDESGTP